MAPVGARVWPWSGAPGHSASPFLVRDLWRGSPPSGSTECCRLQVRGLIHPGGRTAACSWLKGKLKYNVSWVWRAGARLACRALPPTIGIVYGSCLTPMTSCQGPGNRNRAWSDPQSAMCEARVGLKNCFREPWHGARARGDGSRCGFVETLPPSLVSRTSPNNISVRLCLDSQCKYGFIGAADR